MRAANASKKHHHQKLSAVTMIKSRASELKTLGELLRFYRRLYGKTQKEVAQDMHISYQQYQKYEYDLLIPRQVNRARLSHALDIVPELIDAHCIA